MSDFAASARAELADLREKHDRLAEVLALYEGKPVPPLLADRESVASANVSRFAPTAPAKRINRSTNPDRDRALELAAAALEGLYEPVKTSDIYDVILARGAQIGGKEPKGNLSAMLHHSPVFRSHGRLGWTLTKYDEFRELLGTTPTSDQSEAAVESDDMHGL